MAIQATFTADFSKFDAALKNAQGSLKTFEVSTKNVAQALQRMTVGFDGTKIMREAKLTEAAVRSIGGAAKLTEAEQRKVNSTVTEAIAKYKTLGQVAPKELLDLADATKKVVAPTVAATESVGSLAAKYVSIGAAVLLAKQAIGGLVDFLSASVKSFADSEAAQNRMVAALRAQGTATPSVIRQYTELAATIQRTTAFSDDAAAEMISLFTAIGNVAPAQMGKATKAATDLAAGLGIDLVQAATLVAKAMEGNTGALGRYGVKIDQARVAAEGADVIFGAINERFGGQAAAQLDTYAGRLANLANLWDDFKEAVGQAIVEDEAIQQLMKDAPAIIHGMTSAIGVFATAIRAAHETWKDFQNAITLGAFGAKERFLEMRDAANEAKIAMDLLGNETPMAGTFHDIELLAPALAAIGPKALEAGESFESLDAQLRKVTVAQIEASKAAEKAAQAYKSWSDSLDIGAKAAELEQNFKKLTAEGKLNASATQAIIKQYNDLRPALEHLSQPLENLRTSYQKVLESQRVWGAQQAMINALTLPDAVRLFESGQTAVDQFGVHLKYLESTSIDLGVAMNAIPGKTEGIVTVMRQTSAIVRELRRDFAGLVEGVSGAFAEMIVSAKGFKDGFLGVWQAIKNGIMNILTSILNYFLNTFIKGLLGAITGQSGAFSNAFGGLFSGASKGILGGLLGGGGALAGGAAVPSGVLLNTGIAGTAGTGAAAGDGVFAGTSGALLGGGAAAGGGLLLGMLGKKIFGGAGVKAGAFGAASGAATGALIGSVVPVLGTAIGALVGGVAGLLSGLFGKKESQKVNDARDQMLTQMAAAFGGTGKGGTGVGSDFAILAEQLQKATGSGALFEKFLKASTMKDFQAVTQQVAAALDAYKAKTDAAAAAQQRLAATTEEAKKKLAELEGQMQSLNEEETALNRSEAPEAHMGVVEKRQRERIAAQKAALQAQIDAAKVAAKTAEDAQKSMDELIGKFLRLGDVALDEAERARLALLGIGKNLPPIQIPYTYTQRGGSPMTGTAPGIPGTYSLGEAPEANIGFEERRRMLRGYAKGGPVYAAAGGWLARGTDTVPAMLTPGEYVLPRETVDAIRSGRTQPAVTVNLTITALDGADVERVVRSASFKRALTAAVARNEGGYRTDLRTAIGVR